MNAAIDDLLTARDGVATRDALLGQVTRHAVDHAVATGRLIREHPRVYVDPTRREEPAVRTRAALAYVGVPAAVSHLTGLSVWGLAEPTTGTVHLVTGRRGQRRSGRGLVVHRWRHFESGPPRSFERDGVPVISLDRCLVDSWPLLAALPERRAPVIEAVASWRTTPARLRRALDEVPKLEGRADLRALLAALEAGCRSELELWGSERVFTGPEFGGVLRQHPVHLQSGTVHLDMAVEDVKVAVELDGAAWHGSQEQRERDVRRDAELAALGWLVLRLTQPSPARRAGGREGRGPRGDPVETTSAARWPTARP